MGLTTRRHTIDRLSNAVIKESNKSTCGIRSKHGALILDRKGNIIGKGHNTRINYLYALLIKRIIKTNVEIRTMHAEMSAVMDCIEHGNKDKLHGSTIILYGTRYYSGKEVVSTPCSVCSVLLNRLGTINFVSISSSVLPENKRKDKYRRKIYYRGFKKR